MTTISPLKEPVRQASPRLSPCEACTVRDLSVCGALEPQDLDLLNGIVSNVRYSPGQAIFFEADQADSLFVITGGCVRLHKLMADGRRQITGFMLPSDFLGLALHDTYATTAEAVNDVSTCRFMRRGFETLLEEFPQLEKRLLQRASNELAAMQDQMLLLGRKSAQEKLGTFLMALAHRAARKGNPHVELELPMTRHDIADYLGLTVETVSRCFTRLRRQGVIEISDPHGVRLADMGRLAELSGLDVLEKEEV